MSRYISDDEELDTDELALLAENLQKFLRLKRNIEFTSSSMKENKNRSTSQNLNERSKRNQRGSTNQSNECYECHRTVHRGFECATHLNRIRKESQVQRAKIGQAMLNNDDE